jgi:hypothetical protein
MSTSRLPSLLAPFLVAALAVGAGCSQEAEGQRCDTKSWGNGGNDDCESPLVCTPASTLRSQVDLCCPSDPRLATKTECIPGGGTVRADAGADTGASSTDAGSGGADASGD